jgi:protease I
MDQLDLLGNNVAILVAEEYEDLEFWYPYYRMKEAGADVVVVGTSTSPELVLSKHGYPVEIDVLADEIEPDELDAVIVPGGWAPDKLRRCEYTLSLVKSLFDQGKVVAAICHGGQVLISADVVTERQMTSAVAIKDDMLNAGADWVEQEVVVDGNVISSRRPADLPAFCREIIRAMK